MTSFPANPLPVKTEILINNVWQDISTYVQTRSNSTPIVITGGQSDPNSSSQPSQATLTLKNTDGRFSPGNVSGAYYPYLQRNVQLRISINATSSTGNNYSGYRFWGEVSDWPPLSDSTGTDIYVQITANGPLRRLRNGGGRGSALTRYYATLSGSNAPIAYWPCEDDPFTSSVGTALAGGTNMTVTSGTPFWATISKFDGSLPVLIINKSVLTGNTGSTTATTTNVIRFVMVAPSYGSQEFGCLVKFSTNGTVAGGNLYYRKGGKLQLRLFNAGGANIADSGKISVNADGNPLMVSIELTTSGSNVNWALRTIAPGASTFNSQTTGTITTASVSYVTQVVVDPFANILSTGIGHISVQNALIPLTTVSKRLNGHTSEMGVDRLIRLCNEQAMGSEPQWNETADHWGFEDGTVDSWFATNGAVTNSTVSVTGWPTDGTHSILLTANGSGQPFAKAPEGTSSQPVRPGDRVSIAIDVYIPSAILGQLRANIAWFDASRTFISTSSGPTLALSAGGIDTVSMVATAPANAAYFTPQFSSNATETNGTLIYGDNVRVHPRMGAQSAKRLHELMEEIHDLDQGILKESKKLWGLAYRTRISLINQSPALTLNYAAGQLSGQLQPVHDDMLTKNHIVVKRQRGSKFEVTLNSGTLSVQEPPLGVGRYKKWHLAVAEADEQLAALANHLLTLGTAVNERYPVVEVDLHRTENNANFSTIGGIEIGDYIQITNLPFWYPGSTAKQIVIGYTETLSNFMWNIKWNCRPEQPLEFAAAAIPRW